MNKARYGRNVMYLSYACVNVAPAVHATDMHDG